MKKSANNNMYEVNAESVLARYAEYLDATADVTALAASAGTPSQAARDAVRKSLAHLGFAEDALGWATDVERLSADDVANIVEGLDPLALIVLDENTAGKLAEAYRCEVRPDQADRVLGRNVAAFRDFEALLGDAQDKQRAWAVLKTLTSTGM